ncbi:MAG TPA: ATP-binding protein [Pirellulales bacterium]|jgi:hypothetical protein|nr:ATP-binding protein [Pirellulales bacterium]
MTLPDRLAELLLSHPRLFSTVNLAVDRVQQWMEKAHLTFFPDWTDHGPLHVEQVLVTATSLISDEAWKSVTAQDAAALVLATLLHDSAMLLNEDCFASLVTQPRKRIRGIGDKPWHVLWKEFLIEQQKYGSNALRGMFQDDQLDILLPPDVWTAQQRRIIGEEFLRKHHSRLAHEIALWGLPQVTGSPFRLINGIKYEVRDIAGFIARSHFMELRDCLGYLRNKYDVREYQNIHAVFLMAALRVADYLQLQAERAPREFLRIHKLRNPKSRDEWIAHKGIRDVRQSHEDPKAVFVHAKPKDVKTFLKIKGWLNGIQYELDSSWELLDELNGRYSGLQDLTLTIRRVRSNLDDIRQFGNTVSYVAADIQFRAEGGELLKKLVKPLYGDNPEIGVRELLQNSVDAVRELRVYKPRYVREPIDVFGGTTSNADVVLLFEDNDSGAYFTIEDRGIGMTDAVIREYFLTAGKSLRESREWKSLFLNDGAPVLPRSGRFGVGALAAFLMGDQIHVSSRHFEHRIGYEFTARLNEESIAVKKIKQPGYGTRIRVRLSNRARDTLRKYDSWDWYCLEYPVVERFHITNGSALLLEGRTKRPLPGTSNSLSQWFSPNNPICWHYLEAKGFTSVHWGFEFLEWYFRRFPYTGRYGRYSPRESKRRDKSRHSLPPRLTCNGLVVIDDNDTKLSLSANILEISFLSVIEGSQHLPLTLQRDGLEAALPFAEELADDTLKSLIAFAILFAPQNIAQIASRDVYPMPWKNALVCCSTGTTFLDPGLLRTCRASTLVISRAYDWQEAMPPIKWNDKVAVCFDAPEHLSELSVKQIGRLYSHQHRTTLVNEIKEILEVPEDDRPGTRVISKRLRNGWQATLGACPPTVIKISSLRLSRHSIVECYLSERDNIAPSRLEKMMLRYTGDGVIPYGFNERRTRLKDAISELRPYIHLYREAAERLKSLTGSITRPMLPE